MKPLLLPATCALATALMGGAVLSHHLGLAERIRHARLLAEQQGTAAIIAAEEPSGHARPAAVPASDSETLAFLRRIEGQVGKIAGQVERLDKHVETADRAQQDLRDQVAETNRDLMELQFRVDSHSREFRPLRSVQESPYTNVPGVLPPREVAP